MIELYKDFEDGVLTREQMAEKYGVSPQTITNCKKKYLTSMEEKKHDDNVKSFAKEAVEIADSNIKGGINKDIRYSIKKFIDMNKFDNMEILNETYRLYWRLAYIFQEEGRRPKFCDEVTAYLALCCLFNPDLINEDKYFHYLVSNKED